MTEQEVATTATAQERDQRLRATLAQIETSWNNLQQALADIPEDRLTQPGAVGEDWSVKDLIGHIAFWDEQAVIVAERRIAGEPDRQVDWQAINEREAAARAGRSLADVQAEMRQAHERVLETVRRSAQLAPDLALGVCGCLAGDTWEHYEDHAADVRAWRDRR